MFSEDVFDHYAEFCLYVFSEGPVDGNVVADGLREFSGDCA